ncbi:MAG: hypothetical protein Q7U05_06930 [Polaromonas sp.]|nr:hypothetical protein [Polaromonas sp.]
MNDDQAESNLVLTVWSLTGWDMTGFDEWVDSSGHWKDHPQKLAHLLTLRERLTQAFLTPQVSSEMLCLHADLLLAEAHRVAGVIRGAPLELAVNKQSKKNSLRRQGTSKLTSSEQRGIIRAWKAAISTYGLRKSLAREYEVSEDTITRLINKSAPD